MLKLLKYELKKGYQLKLVIALITLLVEALYLFGIFAKQSDRLVVIAIVGLTLCAIFGTLIIGISSVQTLWRELNSKESYMLFMTPQSSYEILGAKLVESVLSLLGTGALYVALAALDLHVLAIAENSEIGSLFQVFGVTNLTVSQISIFVLAFMSQCLLLYCSAYLAIIVIATLLNGKRYGAWVSFGVYIALNSAISWLGNQMITDHTFTGELYFALYYLAFTIVFYGISSWIMDHKLSV